MSSALVGLLDDLCSLLLGFFDLFHGFVLRQVQILLRPLCRREAVSDFLLTLLDGCHQRRPHELHAKQDKENKGKCLAEDGHIDIHDTTPLENKQVKMGVFEPD